MAVTAAAAPTQDAEVAALHRELYEVLQQVSAGWLHSLLPWCQNRDCTLQVAPQFEAANCAQDIRCSGLVLRLERTAPLLGQQPVISPVCCIADVALGFVPCQVVKLEREKAAAEADKLALGQRLEREWETREAAEAAVMSAAEAAARANARECAALQEALDKVQSAPLARVNFGLRTTSGAGIGPATSQGASVRV